MLKFVYSWKSFRHPILPIKIYLDPGTASEMMKYNKTCSFAEEDIDEYNRILWVIGISADHFNITLGGIRHVQRYELICIVNLDLHRSQFLTRATDQRINWSS